MFERVSLKDTREIHFAEHEILLSFYDDTGAIAFHEWWYEEGAEIFGKWIIEGDEFREAL